MEKACEHAAIATTPAVRSAGEQRAVLVVFV
jgi:hypothetical protein